MACYISRRCRCISSTTVQNWPLCYGRGARARAALELANEYKRAHRRAFICSRIRIFLIGIEILMSYLDRQKSLDFMIEIHFSRGVRSLERASKQTCLPACLPAAPRYVCSDRSRRTRPKHAPRVVRVVTQRDGGHPCRGQQPRRCAEGTYVRCHREERRVAVGATWNGGGIGARARNLRTLSALSLCLPAS